MANWTVRTDAYCLNNFPPHGKRRSVIFRRIYIGLCVYDIKKNVGTTYCIWDKYIPYFDTFLAKMYSVWRLSAGM